MISFSEKSRLAGPLSIGAGVLPSAEPTLGNPVWASSAMARVKQPRRSGWIETFLPVYARWIGLWRPGIRIHLEGKWESCCNYG